MNRGLVGLCVCLKFDSFRNKTNNHVLGVWTVRSVKITHFQLSTQILTFLLKKSKDFNPEHALSDQSTQYHWWQHVLLHTSLLVALVGLF